MSSTIRVLAFSRAVLDDNGTLSPFEYNGSFQATPADWAKAYLGESAKLLIGWARMMDCFDEFLFIAEDLKETATGSLWKLEERHYLAGLEQAARAKAAEDAKNAQPWALATYTENREGDALARGYTRRIYLDNARYSFDLLVKPDAYLDGTFDGYDMETTQWVRGVKGWLFEIEG